MTKRLLIATYHRLDENTGGSNASKGFIRCFAALFADCTLVCQEFPEADKYIPSHVKVVPYRDKRSKLRLAADIYRGVIFGLYYAIKEHLQTQQYDIIVIDHSITGAAICQTIKATGAKMITIHHNVERDYWRDNAKEHSLTYRFPYLYYAKKSERDCLLLSDVNLTVTRRDAKTFHSWYPDIHVHNWGIFDYRDIPPRAFVEKPHTGTFVITGSLSFEQSLQPIIDFIGRYWPLVQNTNPQARLVIAGRNPAEALRQVCSKTAGISLIANPDDMTAVVQQADYYICPIYAGSGLKLRIWDGLRQDLPVICHEVSTAGYEELLGKCIFSYHDEPSFLASLKQMTACRRLPSETYEAFRQLFSISNGTEQLRHILQQENII